VLLPPVCFCFLLSLGPGPSAFSRPSFQPDFFFVVSFKECVPSTPKPGRIPQQTGKFNLAPILGGRLVSPQGSLFLLFFERRKPPPPTGNFFSPGRLIPLSSSRVVFLLHGLVPVLTCFLCFLRSPGEIFFFAQALPVRVGWFWRRQTYFGVCELPFFSCQGNSVSPPHHAPKGLFTAPCNTVTKVFPAVFQRVLPPSFFFFF